MAIPKSLLPALALATLTVAGAPAVQAQGADSVFAPLTLPPAPSQTRLANGAPGPKYWQNQVSYDIKASLDTGAHVVRGSLSMRYVNNSPDVLPILWIQTEQDPNEQIESFTQLVNGKYVPVTVEHPEPTETKVTLAEPLKPGAHGTFQIVWNFSMHPGEGGGRMGRKGKLYEIAQWYPRVNVYDDVKGWNTEPYSTGAEFFEDYGDYTMEVTLPAGYVVAGTGVLTNPKEVLTPTEISRLAVAAKSDSVVHIITAEELASGAARPKQDGTLTWKFSAKNVRDAVWCASPDYQWDATSWHGILAQSYYEPSTASVWDDAADQARMSIEEYSERWYPYPYPQVSVVEGPVSGMEYPMLSMDEPAPTKEDLYDVITHEVGHNWFPMIVGSNERVHTWQDEGFNQFINTFSAARRYPALGDQEKRASFYVRWQGRQMVSGQDAKLETGEVIGNASGQYFKTAAGLEILRRDIMGPEKFDKGLKTYIQRWAYKHPTPMDFFRTMNEAAGENLDWFWREWWLETPTFDQAIDSVSLTKQGDETHATVVYANKGDGVLPLRVQVTFADSTTQEFTYPVDIWKKGNTYTVSYTFKKTPTEILIDPGSHFVDAQRANNMWPAKK